MLSELYFKVGYPPLRLSFKLFSETKTAFILKRSCVSVDNWHVNEHTLHYIDHLH